MESSRGATNLDSREGKRFCLRENEIASEESDGANEMVAEATAKIWIAMAEILLERKSNGNESESAGMRVRVKE